MIGCNHNDFSIVGDITVINKNIKLGHNVTIYPDVMLFGDGEIVIGDNVDIGNGTIIYSSKDGGVTIGNDCWIAAGCKVLKGSHIKDGTVIGALSLVKGEIPENAIAYGIPAEVKKYR